MTPDREFVRSYYAATHYSAEGIAKRKHRKLDLEDPWYQLLLFFIRKWNLPLPGRRWLEVGCGLGGFCSWVKSQSATVVGIDWVLPPVRVAKEAIHSDAPSGKALFAVADGAFLPFKNESFDAVVCSETLEHCFAITALVNEMYRVCVRDGVALVTVPNCIIRFPLDTYLRLTGRSQPEQFISYFGIRKVLMRSGFRIVDEWGADFLWDTYMPELLPEGCLDFRWLITIKDFLGQHHLGLWKIISGTVGFLLVKNQAFKEV